MIIDDVNNIASNIDATIDTMISDACEFSSVYKNKFSALKIKDASSLKEAMKTKCVRGLKL